MNIKYNSALKESLPGALTSVTGNDALDSLINQDVLIKKEAADALRDAIMKSGNGSPQLFEQTVDAIRSSSEAGLKTTFLIAGLTMFLAFILILTIPVIPMDRGAE